MRERIGKRTLWTLMALAVFVASVALAACGGGKKGGTTAAGGGKKLGLMMDVFRNDKSFGTATFQGAQRAAKDFHLKLSVVDGLANKPQQAAAALTNLSRDNDFIIDGASATDGILPRFAARNPNKQFAVYAVPIASASNLHYAFQDWYPLGYMAGVLAAMQSKSNVIGFVGGGQIPPTIRGLAGYQAGAKATKPGIKVVQTITGNFDDAVKGKTATAAELAQNADVIYSFLDAAHVGAVQAVQQSGKKVTMFGVIFPKCNISAGFELGDTVAAQSQLVYDLIKGMVQGNLTNTVYGVQDPAVATFAFCPGKQTPALNAAVSKVRQGFISGQLKSPKS